MDSPKYLKSDPSFLLLNEIEILLAQSRLMELYLKQAQATAANESARIHEQHRTEIGTLQAALAEKEQSLAAHRTMASESHRDLHGRAEALQNLVREKQSLLDDRDQQLLNARSSITLLQERIAQLELAHSQEQEAAQAAASLRQRLHSEVATLRAELEETQRDFQQQQVLSRHLQENLQDQLQQLQSQDAERRAWNETARDELEHARGEIAKLHQQLVEVQASHQEIEAAATRELVSTRNRFETELSNLRAALTERDHSLSQNQNAVAEIEHSLKTEILTLQNQLDQKQSLIVRRDNELREVYAQMAVLQQRIDELETDRRQGAAIIADVENLRRSFEDEIATLQNEVAARERALSERQEAVTAVELALHGKIQALQQELAHARNTIDARDSEVHNARAEAEVLRQQMGHLDSVAAASNEARQHAEETRRSLEAELASLNVMLAQREGAFSEQERHFKSIEEQLNGELNQLRGQLEQQHKTTAQAYEELAQLRSQFATLQEQKNQTDAARRDLEENNRQAATLRQELESRLQAKDEELRAVQATLSEDKENALREQERHFKSIEEQLGGELNQLRGQLDRQLQLTAQANEQLSQLRSRIADLQNQSVQSETLRRELEQNTQQASALRQEWETRLQVKEDELQAAQTDVQRLKSQLDAKIDALQLNLAEKQLLADSRGAEIDHLKTELIRLSEQIGLQESGYTEAKARFLSETESSRALLQAEIAAVRDAHQVKQQTLENELALERENVSNLRAQIQELERRALEAETQFDNRAHHLETTTAESVSLRARVRELEDLRETELATTTELEQARAAFEAELGALRGEVQQKTWALAQQQAVAENLALVHKSQIQKLEAKLVEQQSSDKNRSVELDAAQSQARSFQRRIDELEMQLQHAQMTAASRGEQIRRELETQIRELSSQLAQKNSEHQELEKTRSDLEHSLQNEIDRLSREAHEKHVILQNRNDELVRVKSEMDLLHERHLSLESVSKRNEAATAAETERMSTEYHAQLALLQAELSQKEWALEEQRAATSSIEQHYRQETEALRKRLADQESKDKETKDEFVLGEDKLTEEQRERYKKYREVMDAVKAGPDQSFPASENRRWRTSFSWKRRWKS